MTLEPTSRDVSKFSEETFQRNYISELYLKKFEPKMLSPKDKFFNSTKKFVFDEKP